jgi:hypothetical protein
MFNSDKTDLFSLEVDEQAKTNFLEMARWTKSCLSLDLFSWG